MRSKTNFIRRRPSLRPQQKLPGKWPFPVGQPQQADATKKEDSGPSFGDYVKGIIEKRELDQHKKAYDRAKKVIEEQK